jgi:hypothetical protein
MISQGFKKNQPITFLVSVKYILMFWLLFDSLASLLVIVYDKAIQILWHYQYYPIRCRSSATVLIKPTT